jgi:hypothetical protein
VKAGGPELERVGHHVPVAAEYVVGERPSGDLAIRRRQQAVTLDDVLPDRLWSAMNSVS